MCTPKYEIQRVHILIILSQSQYNIILLIKYINYISRFYTIV